MPHFFILSLYSLVYAFLAYIGVTLLALPNSNISALWLPAGVGFIMYLRFGTKALAFIFITSIYVNVITHPELNISDSLVFMAVAALFDTIIPFFAVYLYRRYLPQRIISPSDLYKFGLYVCFIPSLLSAFLLLVNIYVWGIELTISKLYFIITLTVGNAIGLLLVFAIYSSFRFERKRALKIDIKNIAWLLTPLLFTSIGFLYLQGMIYITLAVLVYLAYSHSTRFLTFAITLNSLLVFTFIQHSFGPFKMVSVQQSYVALILYILMSVLIPLSILVHNYQLYFLQRKASRMENKANHDQLTGLLNRQGFYSIADNLLNKDNSLGVCVAVIDIDFFKKVNDCFGHAAGDHVLKNTANLFKQLFRGDDVVARYGGEEFIITMSNIDAINAKLRLEALIEYYRLMETQYKGKKIKVTISIGAITTQEPCNVLELIEQADHCLYFAKASGRDQLVLQDN